MNRTAKFFNRWMVLISTMLVLIQIPLLGQSGMNEIGSFEQTDPSYWFKSSEPGGSELQWASDEFITLGRSLKINKSATAEAAYWESENMCDIWSPVHYKDVDIKVGAMIKTDGVNVNPATEDAKWYIAFTFIDEGGTLIGELQMPIDQSAATKDWFEVSNEVGSLVLDKDSYTTTIKFVGGKDATGTVWADEFMLNGRTDWAGGIWNETVGVPTGWIYWLPRTDGNISDGYENTRVTDEESYHGKYSLKFDIPKGTHDGFIGTRMYPLRSGQGKTAKPISGANDITELSGVQEGDVLRISAWIKAANLSPDSFYVVGDQWSVSYTPIFHNSLGGNEGFNDVWASDIPLEFPNVTSFDWTQFYVDVVVPADAKSLSMRLHPLGRFQGTVWMDAMEIKKANDVTDLNMDKFLPVEFSLFQNYPNPFNPTTIVSYALPTNSGVTLKIYDMLGKEVKTLVEGEQSAGIHNISWDGANNYGVKVSSGTYIYRIQAGEFVQAKKMLLVK
ncbi:MAG: T9SS type A sorting domain-containing protein [Bacteroidetes bacterium]|nr:T9SS type A sorting domain-containing protein [Bacteroidota bacterium]